MRIKFKPVFTEGLAICIAFNNLPIPDFQISASSCLPGNSAFIKAVKALVCSTDAEACLAAIAAAETPPSSFCAGIPAPPGEDAPP